VACFTASFGAADIGQYTLTGTKGSLTADPAYEYAQALNLKIKVGEKTKTRHFPKRDQFAAEITYFSDCILNNRKPETSGEEGLADVRIVEAIYEAARTGKTLQLTNSEKDRRPSMAQEIHKPAQLGIFILWFLKLIENRMPQDRRGTLSLSAGDSTLSEEEVRATLASADCKVISSARTYAERAQLLTLRFEVQWKSRANDSSTPRFVEQLAHHTSIAILSWQP
jgi:hypothetical protein